MPVYRTSFEVNAPANRVWETLTRLEGWTDIPNGILRFLEPAATCGKADALICVSLCPADRR
jgi:hypothetical protein